MAGIFSTPMRPWWIRNALLISIILIFSLESNVAGFLTQSLEDERIQEHEATNVSPVVSGSNLRHAITEAKLTTENIEVE